MANNPWTYNPSPAAAIIFLLLFTIATLWHAVLLFTRRTWYFIPFIIGGALEIIGYATRYLGSKDLENLTFFIIQTLAILVAPALLAASIYMVLGRLVVLVRAEAYLPVRPTWLTKIFVGGDILSFIIQIAGSGMLSSNFSLGKAIILVGLAIQLIFFGLFVLSAALFYRRLDANPTPTTFRLDACSTKGGWRGVMHVLFLTSALIFVRSVFRFVEFTGDHDSPMMTSEAYIYICDSLLMFGVMSALLYLHPSEYIRAPKDMNSLEGEEL
ncbi:RTA1 like protein-domain-containing protein [Fusarium avenaceum]|nr:RTA1 like protein-domain-containing protein [Fusarium avenaceum]